LRWPSQEFNRNLRFEISERRGGHTARAKWECIYFYVIRKMKSGEFRLYSRKKDAATGKRRNLGTSLERAKQHEREVQYFKKH